MPSNSHSWWCKCFLTGITCICFSLQAKGYADDEQDAETFELSPFIVEADEDIGYLPVSTLAGTRLRTEFRDIGASIDAMTQEFLDDVGIVTVEESFIYTAHVEGVHETGQDSIYGPIEGSSDLPPGSGTRAMGLSPPVISVNFFLSLLPLDRYNTERIVIARGPQAILFGFGSPSGVVNTSLTRAGFDNDFREFHTRFDNWGSRRWEFDVNQELIADQLAVRFAMVDDNQRFWLDPCSDNRERKYGTVTIKPLDSINIRVHHETFDREGHVPTTQLPRDYVSYFFEANNAELIGFGNAFWAPRTPANVVSIILNSEGETQPLFRSLRNYSNILSVAQVIGMVSSESSGYFNPQDPFYDPDWTEIDDIKGTKSLSDDTYYPIFDKYIAGDINTTQQDGYSTDAFAEMNIFKEAGPFSDCFVELAFHQAEFNQLAGGMFAGAEFALKVDPNRYFPDGRPNPNAGRYYIDSGNNWIEGKLNKSETLRLTASVRLDLNDRFPFLGSHRFGMLLSNHQSEENRQGAFRNIGNIGGIIGGIEPEAFTGVPMSGAGTNWRFPLYGRRLHTLVYLDEEDGVLYPSRDMIPWGGPLDTWYVPTEDGTFGIYAFDPDGPGMWDATHSIRRRSNSGSFSWQGWFDIPNIATLVTTYGYRKDEIDGKEKHSPGWFTNSFGETLTIEEDTMIRETGFYAHWDLLEWDPSWSDLGEFDNEAKAAVLQLDPLMDRAFDGNFRMAFNYSESTNNSGFSTLRNANGEVHPGQRGSGNNYGIRLEFMQNRYRLSVNKWEVDLIGADAIDVVSLVKYDISLIEYRWKQIEPDSIAEVVNGTGGYISDPNEVLASRGANQYGVFADQEAQGWTVDFVANPIPGLRIRANLSRTEAVQANIGADWINWIRNVRSPLWTDEIQWWDDSDGDGEFRPVLAWDPALSMDLNSNGIPDTVEDGDYNMYLTLGNPDNPSDIANILSGWDQIAMDWDYPSNLSNRETIKDAYLARIEGGHLLQADGYEGLSNPDIRKWRFNLTGTYTFQEGFLENVSIGGSVRYRDKPFIGTEAKFVVVELQDGSKYTVTTEDPTHPLYGDAFWFFDAMIGYRDKFLLDGRPIEYALQINVRNILDEDDPYTTDATSSGLPVRMAQNIPREIFLSASLEF